MLQGTLRKWAWYQSKRTGFIVPHDDLFQEYNFYLCRMLSIGQFPSAWNTGDYEYDDFMKTLRVHLCGSKASLTANLYRKYKRILDHEVPLCPEDNSQKSIPDRSAVIRQLDAEFIVDLENIDCDEQDREVLIALATGQICKQDIPTVLNWENTGDRKKLSRYMKKLQGILVQI